MLRIAVALLALPGIAFARTVVLLGATGQSGLHTYQELKKLQNVTVRALVRNAAKAKSVLGCDKCDHSEGIFEGDVTAPDTLAPVFEGADVLVSTLGSTSHCKVPPIFGCTYPTGAYPKDINWLGNKAAAEALAKAGGKQVVLMSTMGTTTPDNFLDKLANGHVSFYSLQMEAWLAGSGLDFTTVKACGLTDGEPGHKKFLVGHDDAGFNVLINTIRRSDVARVLAGAVADPAGSKGLRFDLCTALIGKPTGSGDVAAVFQDAMFPWDSRRSVVEHIVV